MIRPAAKLPGIYLETADLPPADELPRMDIAAFVGFAASGPLHTPVPVDDIGRFREIFGADVTLARDLERGEMEGSLLGPAVEAFFANGGRRCWVVRVADATRAVTLRLPLPGLSDAAGSPVGAPARSPGIWPLGLAADTQLLRLRYLSGDEGLAMGAGGWSLALIPPSVPPVAGDLLEMAFPAAALVALGVVEGVETVAGRTMVRGTALTWREQAADDRGPLGVENAGLLPIAADDAAARAGLPAAPDRVERLSFELAVWQGSRVIARLSDLGFSAAHPRFWGLLPDDAALFEPLRGRPQPPCTAEAARLIAEAATPRFPLAAPQPTPDPVLPWGMRLVTDRDVAGMAARPAGTALEIDGLAAFDDGLFLDPDMVRSPTGELLETMEAKHSTSLAPFGVAPEARLVGLHSLLTAQEVSMVAVPDAVHRRWNRDLPPEDPALAAPILAAPSPEPDGFGRIALSWTEVPGAARYQLETARDPSFVGASVTEVEEAAAVLPAPAPCPEELSFRVRAERGGVAGPWSNIRAEMLPAEDFGSCDPLDRLAPVLLRAEETGSPAAPLLVWEREAPALSDPVDRFELQESIAPSMHGAATVTLPDPSGGSFAPPPIAEGGRYYRVRLIRGGAAGPWSNTVRIAPQGRDEWVAVPEAEHDGATLVAVHRALIRFCAARADAVALLALPRHYRAEAIADHLAGLMPQVDPAEVGPMPVGRLGVTPIGFGEEAALSYAALWHPWIAVAAETRLGFQTPDGPAAGLLARRSLTEGAWIAEANLPVAGAVALTPQFDRNTVVSLIARQINPAVRDARGFLFFNTETLSLTEELRPLPVRRLMILLRRLALREGATYVFEPNSDDFRALVRRRFERLLSQVHQRGGLAGTTPEASFVVVTDESVNPRMATDLGRFTVELRVAPSRPFRFLNIRLLQTGPQEIQVREA